MDPKPSSSAMLLAPPSSGSSAALRFPEVQARPRLDEHVVRPEAREELVRGLRIEVMPAKPPHADRHFGLDYVLGAHIRPEYVGSTELLSHLSESADFATDTCVRRKGVNPTTGERHLEELAFEVVNEQSLRDLTAKAEDLSERGVRRVIAIFVKKGEVCEWSPSMRAWQRLEHDGVLHDPTLAHPLEVKALLDAAAADNAVVRALDAKETPALVELKAESRSEGLANGLREGIELACELLGIELTAERRALLARLDAAGLGVLRDHLRAERRWP